MCRRQMGLPLNLSATCSVMLLYQIPSHLGEPGLQASVECQKVVANLTSGDKLFQKAGATAENTFVLDPASQISLINRAQRMPSVPVWMGIQCGYILDETSFILCFNV